MVEIASAILAPLAEKGAARLVDFGITLVLSGIAREAVVTKVRDLEAQGKTPDEITDGLQAWRKQTEEDAQKEIDLQRGGATAA